MTNEKYATLPVVIIGGGPIGLAAAAHLVKKGEKFILLEAGETVGSSILRWGHVRMFSTWTYNMDKVSRELLDEAGWTTPNEKRLPTGNDLVEQYLNPLSQLPQLKQSIMVNSKVVGVTRRGLDKLKSANRSSVPFEVYVEKDGEEIVMEAKAVIDSSGTWTNPNPALSNGLWTNVEKQLKNRIYYGIPNVKQLQDRYKNKSVMVVGSGHSAINALLDLSKLKAKYCDTKIYWVVRKNHISEAYGGQEKDALQARGLLGSQIQRLVESKEIQVFTPFHIRHLKEENGRISVSGMMNSNEVTIGEIDELVVTTGFRPDVTFLSEIRIDLDQSVESVYALAPLIDPNIHNCGTVRPHGEKELRQPEKDFYIVGMKSYGRAPTFLLATGYEQVRSVVDYLTGDEESSREVHLELPETGVCSSDKKPQAASSGETLSPTNRSCCS